MNNTLERLEELTVLGIEDNMGSELAKAACELAYGFQYGQRAGDGETDGELNAFAGFLMEFAGGRVPERVDCLLYADDYGASLTHVLREVVYYLEKNPGLFEAERDVAVNDYVADYPGLE